MSSLLCGLAVLLSPGKYVCLVGKCKSSIPKLKRYSVAKDLQCILSDRVHHRLYHFSARHSGFHERFGGALVCENTGLYRFVSLVIGSWCECFGRFRCSPESSRTCSIPIVRFLCWSRLFVLHKLGMELSNKITVRFLSRFCSRRCL